MRFVPMPAISAARPGGDEASWHAERTRYNKACRWSASAHLIEHSGGARPGETNSTTVAC